MPLQGGGDVIPVRLRNALLRILNRSLVKFRTSYVPSSVWDKMLNSGHAPNAISSDKSASPDGQVILGWRRACSCKRCCGRSLWCCELLHIPVRQDADQQAH